MLIRNYVCAPAPNFATASVFWASGNGSAKAGGWARRNPSKHATANRCLVFHFRNSIVRSSQDYQLAAPHKLWLRCYWCHVNLPMLSGHSAIVHFAHQLPPYSGLMRCRVEPSLSSAPLDASRRKMRIRAFEDARFSDGERAARCSGARHRHCGGY